MAVQSPPTTKINFQEFWEFVNLPENKNRFFELLEGEIVEVMPSNPKPSYMAARIIQWFMNYLDEHPLGRVTEGQGGYTLSENTTVAPDVAYISKARQKKFPATGFNPVAPDLAVEVMSPSDDYAELLHKVSLYLRHGTQRVWIVESQYRTVTVYTPNGVKIYEEGDVLDAGNLLPGFSLPVAKIFADLPDDDNAVT